MIGNRFGRRTWLVALALATVVACREAEQVPAASSAAFSGADLHVDVSLGGGTAREGENDGPHASLPITCARAAAAVGCPARRGRPGARRWRGCRRARYAEP